MDHDSYLTANGHINFSRDSTNPIAIQSPQQIPAAYTVKNISVCEYAGSDVPMEYATDYANPNHVNLINEHDCSTIDGCTDFGDHLIRTDANNISLRSQSYVTNSVIDGNGYITNGNMRIPPEGMEATCTIAPQWWRHSALSDTFLKPLIHYNSTSFNASDCGYSCYGYYTTMLLTHKIKFNTGHS